METKDKQSLTNETGKVLTVRLLPHQREWLDLKGNRGVYLRGLIDKDIKENKDVR